MRAWPMFLIWLGAGTFLAAVAIACLPGSAAFGLWLPLGPLAGGVLLLSAGTIWMLLSWQIKETGRRRNSEGRCTKCNYRLANLAAGAACPGCGTERTHCSQCNYNLAGLVAGAACPECGAGSARFPLFVLIPDEQTFLRRDDQNGLNYFEQVDVEEMAHWAWDTKGRKYKLVWRRGVGTWPELIAEDGAADFRAAAEEYRQRIASSGLRPSRTGRCDPEELFGGRHCPKCNYDRAGLAAGAACPECGAPFA